MIHIHKQVFISNGEKIIEPGYHFGTYKDGTEYYVGNYKIIFVTDKLTDNLEPSNLNVLLKQSKFDFDFIKKYNSKDYLDKMAVCLDTQIIKEEKRKELQEAKDKLFSKYSLSEELKERIVNLDIFYDYSDDRVVYNRGLERYDQLFKDLEEVNAGKVLGLYRNLLTNKG